MSDIAPLPNDVQLQVALDAWLKAEVTQQPTSAQLDHNTLLDVIARYAVERIGDMVFIMGLSHDRHWLRPVKVYHPDPDLVDHLHMLLTATTIRLGQGVLGHVAATGTPALIPVIDQAWLNASVKPELLPALDRCRPYSQVIVPMQAHGRVLGTLGLLRHHPHQPYTLDDQFLLQDLADRVTPAIDHGYF